MFNGVEYVREVCQQRNIAISTLEKECGFANGYLNPKKLKKIPYERAVVISKYLGVSVDLILTGKEKAPTASGERKISDRDIMFALWGDTNDMDKGDLDDVKRYAAFVRERKKQK